MNEIDDLVKSIKSHTIQLIKENKVLKVQNESLENDREENQKKIELLNRQIENLTEKNRNLLFAKSVKHGEGNSVVKNRIDEMVREINKCIELLNR